MLQIPLAAARPRRLPDRSGQLVEACAAGGSGGHRRLDARERSALEEALGFGTRGARPRQAQAAMKELDDQQKARAKRFQRDAIDRALTELTGFYRDLLSIQTASGAGLVNADLHLRSPCWLGSRPRSRRCAASMRCSAAELLWRAMWLRCSRSRATLIALVEG